MGRESLNKIKTTRKPESRRFNLDECFFHGLFKSFEKGKQFTGGAGPGCSHWGDGYVATKPFLFGMRAVILIIK